jgi:hypothetical protein
MDVHIIVPYYYGAKWQIWYLKEQIPNAIHRHVNGSMKYG